MEDANMLGGLIGWFSSLNTTEIIGLLAGAGTTASFVPQVLKIFRDGDTSAISLGMYTMFFSGVCLWLIYGIMSDQLPVILPNLITMLLAGVVLTLKVIAVIKGRDQGRKKGA
jgi:MtN3 and saliva related transmembrane protein